MPKFICLQAGHEGVTSGQTGAPGEQELNKRIRARLSEILISKGFQVQLVNANPTDTEIDKDFDLFLALHGDANIYGVGGGCIAAPHPDYDQVNEESIRIKNAIESEYFKHSEIVNHPERVNKNMTMYYMWNRLTPKTPCVIIEMGVVQDAHDKVLLADTERIATALARGICKAFNVVYDVPAPNPCAEKWEKMCQYLGITNDPTTTSFEDAQRVIAGIRSRATDMEKQAAYWETECKNRTEQVSRLKGDIASLSNEKNSLQEQYNKIVSEVQKMADLYKGQLDAKQGVIDEKCRQIGDLNHQIAELQAKQDYETIATIDFMKSKYKVIKLK